MTLALCIQLVFTKYHVRDTLLDLGSTAEDKPCEVLTVMEERQKVNKQKQIKLK